MEADSVEPQAREHSGEELGWRGISGPPGHCEVQETLAAGRQASYMAAGLFVNADHQGVSLTWLTHRRNLVYELIRNWCHRWNR